MSVIGEAALAAFFEVLFSKLASAEFLNAVTEKQVGQELKKWKKILPCIQAVLDDAEEKHMKDGHVKRWLAELQDLAYDADDVLDEFATEALRRKLTREHQDSSSKLQKLLPTCIIPHLIMKLCTR
ncbi:Disease resistance protein RPS2 [Theobroma cacao]|uniref:Disease resistance protein RPS2 n=1 Tax=Theobroma cacao TaxID=3641 RepID=A0A061FRU7_THECC|nr:Disease resistance protein RPS2 [Theobroma cacao]